ncbi:MAG: FkbM family methyltransferase [Sciscionella sp.]
MPTRTAAKLRGTAAAAVLRALARTTPWLESELLGLQHVVRPGDHCLDVGAALGIYTAVLSDLVGQGGVVHSVEPLRFAYPPTLRRLLAAPGRNVRSHRVALGSKDAECTMSLPVRNGHFVTGRSFLTAGTSGLGSNDEFDAHVQVDVPAQTLDSFSAQSGIDRLDFVKADVEGAELDLLEGGAETIARFRPSLLLEIEQRHVERYGRAAESVAEWLTERGYTMRVWRGSAWQPVDRLDPERRNHLFVP